MAASVPAPPPAAAAAASNPGKRKKPPRGKGRGNPSKGKKLKGADELARRRRKPSTKFLKLLEKRARDYNSDDDDGGEKRPRPRPRPPVQKREDSGDAAVDSDDDDEGLSEEEEEASSSGDESGGAAVTRFEQGCRAFRVAFSKIIAKKLPDDPLGPILSAHKKLVAAKLAEEAEEHKSKGVARKEKRVAAEKSHIIPANILIDNKEKMLMKVATQGVVRLFNEVSKRQNPRKGLNPSRSKALAKERTQTVPSNQGQKGQASSNFSKHTGKDENEPGWAPLRDTYMLGSKLKDWDKIQDPDAAKQTEVHFDNFSDEE